MTYLSYLGDGFRIRGIRYYNNNVFLFPINLISHTLIICFIYSKFYVSNSN